MIALPERLPASLADRYRIEREPGGGGMSRVYLAEELALPVVVRVLARVVVVKVLAQVVVAKTTARLVSLKRQGNQSASSIHAAWSALGRPAHG